MASLLITLLIIVDVAICLLAILLVMMQRPSQEGLGAAFGGGVTDQMFGAQTTNVLQRGTVYMTIAFFIVNLLLSVLIARQGTQDKDLGSKLRAALPVESTEEGAVPSEKAKVGGEGAVPVESEAVEVDTSSTLPVPKPISENAQGAQGPPAETVQPPASLEKTVKETVEALPVPAKEAGKAE